MRIRDHLALLLSETSTSALVSLSERWARIAQAAQPDDALTRRLIAQIDAWHEAPALTTKLEKAAEKVMRESVAATGPDIDDDPVRCARVAARIALAGHVYERPRFSPEVAADVGELTAVAAGCSPHDTMAAVEVLWGWGRSKEVGEIALGLLPTWQGTLDELWRAAWQLQPGAPPLWAARPPWRPTRWPTTLA